MFEELVDCFGQFDASADTSEGSMGAMAPPNIWEKELHFKITIRYFDVKSSYSDTLEF